MSPMTQKTKTMFDFNDENHITILFTMLGKPGWQNSFDDSNDDSYFERMHKCSAAQWEKRLECKHRDYHREKMNNNTAGVLHTGSSRGFEGFSRRRPSVVTRSKSFNASAVRSIYEVTSD